ncbi:hypothetical protein ACJRO7_032002 [Eucalyptus globulus]|uniref:FLZ-type domain-containing protein n=1 Tax=Eucalyptus globulus TaxID=34317 RepID=A0ABD3JLF4_EUCGL
MLSPRHHVIDVEQSESVGESGTRPAAESTLAEKFLDQRAIAGREQDPNLNVEELVVKSNVDPTRDGGRPGLAPKFFIGTPDDTPEGDTNIRRNSTIDDPHFHRVGYSGEILENCSWCKRKLPENADLYMYGYDLGAYCSVDCRSKRMAVDGRDRIKDKQCSRCHLL